MEFLSVAGGALLTIVFERLFNKLELSRSLNLQKQVLVKLRNWESLLPKIFALLEDAEEKQMSNSCRLVKIWLAEIKDLAYDIEDILDEFQVDSRRSNLISKPHQANTSKFIPPCFNCFKQSDLISDSQTISKVDNITLRLQRVVDESKTLGLIISSTRQAGDKPSGMATRKIPTTSLLEPHVCGREIDEVTIIQKLLNDEGSSKGYSIVPILGMGGIGKTTLAQLVYNKVRPESFELKVWVCVSDQFDITRITRTILEAIGGKCVSKDLNLLQQELNRKLSNKKFLLVLDDIWNENYSLWDSLQKPFLAGAAGSKIIITTRNERVVEIMGGMDRVYRLEVLKDEECLSVFAQHALGADNFDAHPNFREIDEKIVKRCKGLPLAAKTLGGLLRGKLNRSAWEHILNSEIWELQESESNILPALRLSYHYLPSYLKACFASCALFPKDFKFVKNNLVLLWMAWGVVQQQSIETGQLYFSELVSRAFFQRSSGNESHYVMHDLVYDLAQFVAGESFFNLELMLEVDNKSKVNFDKVRHLSFIRGIYDMSKKFEVLKVMKCLRTFIAVGSWIECNVANTVVHDWLPKLRYLRVLSLVGYQIQKFPDSIGELKALKYLNLSRTLIKSLPESVGFLLQLQTLLLFNYGSFFKFPVAIGNLIDLHHLNIGGTVSLKEMPLGICNLKNLLTLSKFIVGKENRLMRLSNLKIFPQLRGNLSILNLQNVLNVQDALEANLQNIDGLNGLLLEWTSDSGSSSNEKMQVLNWLKPHSKLSSLTIVSYGGQKFPSWIGDPFFSNLSFLKLEDCMRCNLLPSLGLLPVLKELIIEGMVAIEAVGPEFYGHGAFSSLEKLVFQNMDNWKTWTSPAGSGGEFPCLGELEIKNCPKLTGQLPSHLSSLENLVIEGCPDLKCSSMSFLSLKKLYIRDCNAVVLKSMVDSTSLTKLTIEHISELSFLPKCFTQSLTALENLEIGGCKKLTCLWEEGSETVNLARLEKLVIRSCPLPVLLTEKEQGLLPLNLKCLGLYSCEALESLTDLMMMKMDGTGSSSSSSTSMLRLEELELDGCPSLKSISLPTTLKRLRIARCENLESLPDGIGGSSGNSTNMQKLEVLELDRCPSLKLISLPTTLRRLTIERCENFESLPDGILMQDDGDNNSNLEYLFLNELPSLNSFQSGQLPASLQKLDVRDCKLLESFPKGMLQHCARLQLIRILGCHVLRELPLLDCLSNLVELQISDCKALESIPDLGLCIPNLKELTIDGCNNLKSFFPNTTMAQLKSLHTLWITDCPSIELIPVGNEDGGLLFPSNLTELQLDDSILKFLPLNTTLELTSTQKLSNPVPDGHLATVMGWGLHNLTSLRDLIIFGTCPLNIVLPSSLTSFIISGVENLESIPRELLQNLNSLQMLSIYFCPKLRSLPKKSLPPSLGLLSILGCPLLKPKRFEAKGDYWPLTCTIPEVEIDGHQVFP